MQVGASVGQCDELCERIWSFGSPYERRCLLSVCIEMAQWDSLTVSNLLQIML